MIFAICFFLSLWATRVAAEDFQPALPLPDLFPQVGVRCPPFGLRRIARAAVVALVERQERRSPGRPAVVVMWTSLLLTAKWTSAPLGKRQQRLGGLALGLGMAVEAVLVDRVLTLWVKVGLQFDRRDRHAVEEQHQVDAVLVVQRISHLPHDAQAVGGVAGQDVGVDRQGGLELGQRKASSQAQHLDAMAQHIQRAALVDLLAQAVEQGRRPRAPWFLVSVSQALG